MWTRNSKATIKNAFVKKIYHSTPEAAVMGFIYLKVKCFNLVKVFLDYEVISKDYELPLRWGQHKKQMYCQL